MVAIVRGALVLSAVLMLLPRASSVRAAPASSLVAAQPAQDPESRSLFAQSVSLLLERQFPSPAISYLLIDAAAGSTLAERWPDVDEAVPVGSLVKPFVALAFGATHGGNFPTVTCHGTKDSCWLPAGHGRLSLTRAIADSCNAYFLVLTERLNAADLAPVCKRYGLDEPDADASSRAYAGLDREWRVRPSALAHAYLKLALGPRDGTAALVLAGMEQSASTGTGHAIGASMHGDLVLSKTGTAPCTHHPRAAADGFTVAIVPAEAPRMLLLVRVHGVTGAIAARTAGQMLALLERRK